MSDNTLPWICVFAILALVIAVSVWLFKPRKPRKVVYGPFCESNHNPLGCRKTQLVAEMRGEMPVRCECFEKQYQENRRKTQAKSEVLSERDISEAKKARDYARMGMNQEKPRMSIPVKLGDKVRIKCLHFGFGIFKDAPEFLEGVVVATEDKETFTPLIVDHGGGYASFSPEVVEVVQSSL